MGALALLVCLLPGLLRAQDSTGYRLFPDRVVVSTPEHWRAWESTPGVRVIEADGTVRPRLIRASANAVADAGLFRRIEAEEDTVFGGIWAAGSNAEEAARIIDGDPATFWEPGRDDPVEDWYVEVDLGRAVLARRIAVRFADEGDPFLKFRLMISDGRQAFGRGHKRQFFRVAQVNRRNKDQREFEFEIEPLRPVPEGVEGEVVQFVRFDALESDGPRGAEVSPEEYARLDSLDRGTVDYFRRTGAGRQIPVAAETYPLLPEAERGPVRYYRHERPRLAELEVHGLGDNVVALTQSELLEAQDFFSNILRRQLTDGLYSSSFELRPYDAQRDRNQLDVDLGGKYWLDRVRLLSSFDPPVAYQVRVSDGSLDPEGRRIWQSFDERTNPTGFLQLEERFPLQEVRYLEVRRLVLVDEAAEQGNLSEVQAYGEGYVSEVLLTSPLIRLGRPRIFSALTWEGESLPGTRIEVRTRSGDDLLRTVHYFDKFGRQITQARWENIRDPANRGPQVVDEQPGPRWSNWSEIYPESGGPFRSPNPRQMVQVQVALRSSEALRAPSLRRLQLHFTAPLVDQALAEIWPVREVDPGAAEEFTLYLRPRIAAGDPGFERLRLRSSSSAPLELVSLQAGSDAQLRQGSAAQLWPGPVRAERDSAGALELVFPQAQRQGERVYALRFRTRLFLNSTTFSAELLHGQRPGVVQVASEGDASALAEAQSLVVVADLSGSPLVGGLALVPPVFTPNGDGINDRAGIEFSVFHLEGAQSLQVGVFTLAGERVRDLSQVRQSPSGEYRLEWDGRGEGGGLAPPGIYLVRLRVEGQAERRTLVRAVRVVY
jgi:hypothetical protein